MDRLMRIEEVAEALGVKRTTLYFWRKENVGPPATRMGRSLVWRERDVKAWIDAQFEQAAG